MIINKPKRDNAIPIEVGFLYQTTPGFSSADWLEIVSKDRRNVRAIGLYNNHADLTIPIWKFDDLIENYIPAGWFLLTEDGDNIVTEDGLQLLWR